MKSNLNVNTDELHLLLEAVAKLPIQTPQTKRLAGKLNRQILKHEAYEKGLSQYDETPGRRQGKTNGAQHSFQFGR